MKLKLKELKKSIKNFHNGFQKYVDKMTQLKNKDYYSSGEKRVINNFNLQKTVKIAVILVIAISSLIYTSARFYKSVIEPWRDQPPTGEPEAIEELKVEILDYADFQVSIDKNGNVLIDEKVIDSRNRSYFFDDQFNSNKMESYEDEYLFWNHERILSYRFSENKKALVKTYSLPGEINSVAHFSDGLLVSCNNCFYFYDGNAQKIAEKGPMIFAATDSYFAIAEDHSLKVYGKEFEEINAVDYNFTIDKLFSSKESLFGITKSDQGEYIIVKIGDDGLINTAEYLKPGFDLEHMYLYDDMLIYSFKEDKLSMLALFDTQSFKYVKSIKSPVPNFVSIDNDALYIGFKNSTKILDLNTFELCDSENYMYTFTPRIYQWEVQQNGLE